MHAEPSPSVGQVSVLDNPLVRNLVDCSPDPIALLNQDREIVLANDKLSALVKRPLEELIGKRPGEAIACAHIVQAGVRCGTTDRCSHCGALRAILGNLETARPAQEECLATVLLAGSETALELAVQVRTVIVDGDGYQVVAFRNLTDTRRREVLERTFFHDVLNIAGGLQGLLELLDGAGPEEVEETLTSAREASVAMIEEITAQRDLTAAEKGELDPRHEPVDLDGMIRQVRGIYATRFAGRRPRFNLIGPEGPAAIETDPTLLRRVLGNLVKNAMEASTPEQAVTLAASLEEDRAVFTVHNESAMPETVQAQIFQRSFSTKSSGRGLGTWSIKLLTTRYLGGTVEFRSTPAEGTTFIVVLPAG